jgi:hypothetical protein
MRASDHDGTEDAFWVVDWKECDTPVQRKFFCLTLALEDVTDEKIRIFVLT